MTEMNHNKIARTAKINAGLNSDGEGDHLSNLPDNMITEIFSYLTMQEAIAVCISCKKMMHLWTTIPHLEFKETADDSFNLLVDTKKRNLVQVINRFLKNHSYPIQTFKLLFYPECYIDDILSWINLIMPKGLIELDLDFMYNLGLPRQLSTSPLNSETLQVLKLRSCVLDSSLGFPNMSSLKSLFLADVTLNDDTMSAFLCQSGHLQSVRLEFCGGFESIKVTDINAKLDYLSIENCYELNYFFAPRVRALSIYNGGAHFFFIEASQITNCVLVPKSPDVPCIEYAHERISEILDTMRVSEDEEGDHLKNLEYQGVTKIQLETYSCNFKELHGHTWLLKNAYVDKVVLSMFYEHAH